MKLVSLENLSKYNELLSRKTVKSVNSITPDSNGNIALNIVKSINGNTPGANGDVELDTVSDITFSGKNLNIESTTGNTKTLTLPFSDVKTVNNVQPDSDGNIQLGTEKSTFNKVVYDTGYFSIGTVKTYTFDLTGTDLENVSKENVNIRLVAKVTTAHSGFEVGDIVQLTTAIDHGYTSGDLDVCSYIRGNTLYVYSGSNQSCSAQTQNDAHLQKTNVQIKAILTAFVPDDGSILLIAEDHNNTSKLIGLPDGTLTWNSVNLVPTGKIEWFAFNTAPDGYLVCNGAKVSRTTYADLFAVIGTTFGSGDDSTTFNIPDLRDRYVIGANTNALGTRIAEQLPNIKGSFLFEYRTNSGGSTNTNYTVDAVGSLNGGIHGAFSFLKDGTTIKEKGTTNGIQFNSSDSNSVYTDNGHVYPLSLALLPCIKY